AIGAESARLINLIGVEQEVFAQRRQMRRLTGAFEIIQVSLKGGAVRQDRKAGRASGLKCLGQRRRVEVRSYDPFRGARLLDLADQRDSALVQLLLDRMGEASRRIMVLNFALERRTRHAHLG